jgi:hypothetical protein
LEPLYGLLFSLFRGHPNHGQWVIACLQGAWPKIVGERLAAVCRPVRIENANLLIEILDREWDPVVKSMKQALLDKLQSVTAGGVKTITFSRH